MARLNRIVFGVGILALSGACSPTDPTYTAFFREAGAAVDRSDLGLSVADNAAYMTGKKRIAYDLGVRFAREVDPTVTFDFDSARLDDAARATLRQQAEWMRQFPEARFRVYGHTDAVGSEAYNKRLGLRRAMAVVDYLVSQGISRDRLEAVVSFGETQPVIPTPGRERRNRRTVTEVSGFVEGHPNVLDGKYAAIIYREYVKSGEPKSTIRNMEGESVVASTGG